MERVKWNIVVSRGRIVWRGFGRAARDADCPAWGLRTEAMRITGEMYQALGDNNASANRGRRRDPRITTRTSWR
jgi:hypothetical protein